MRARGSRRPPTGASIIVSLAARASAPRGTWVSIKEFTSVEKASEKRSPSEDREMENALAGNSQVMSMSCK